MKKSKCCLRAERREKKKSLTDWVELIVGGKLLEEGLAARSGAVEGQAGEKYSLFDRSCRERGGEAQGGEMEEQSEGDGEALHGWITKGSFWSRCANWEQREIERERKCLTAVGRMVDDAVHRGGEKRDCGF